MPATLIIFGAAGALTSRKLIPALYELFRKKRLPTDTRIVGFSRTPFSDEQWRTQLAETAAKFLGKAFDAALWKQFAALVHYQPGDIGAPADFEKLSRRLD